MSTHIEDKNQIDLEEAIMQVNARDFGEEFHLTENDEETAIFLMHECSDKSLHNIEANIHHQIDPSYQ